MHYDPSAFLRGEAGDDWALVVLNQPIVNDELFEKSWAAGKVRVCADGGANRLYDYATDREKYLPDFITGDMDSLRDDVRDYYAKQGVEVLENPDQESTDFMKAVKLIATKGHFNILALGAIGGRLDQSFHSIHHLFLSQEQNQLVYLLADQSITFLLAKGESTISTPLENLGEAVGIIPIAGPAIITTNGLVYDVQDWHTSFGTQVSTSNYLREPSVTIVANEPVLFTCELKTLD